MKQTDFYSIQRNTQGFKKFLNFMEKLKSDSSFVEELQWLRSFHKNKESGESISRRGMRKPKSTFDFRNDLIAHLPKFINGSIEQKLYSERRKMFEQKYELNMFGEAMECLILYNSVDPLK